MGFVQVRSEDIPKSCDACSSSADVETIGTVWLCKACLAPRDEKAMADERERIARCLLEEAPRKDGPPSEPDAERIAAWLRRGAEEA